MITLDNLILSYAENKQELDDYKKICDRENQQIKDMMMEQELEKYTDITGRYTVQKVVQKRETVDEEAMLDILKTSGKEIVPFLYDFGIIKTREYIDTDALEKAVYNGDIPSEVLADLGKAKSVKEVVTLRLTKEKKK